MQEIEGTSWKIGEEGKEEAMERERVAKRLH